MEVILLGKIRHLGVLGDIVKVKPGYGRNYLVPKGLAVYATKSNVTRFEERRAELEKAAAVAFDAALEKQKALATLPTLSLKAKAGEEGKLFGSIGTRDIADAVTHAGVEISKSQVRLPQGTLRYVGEYDIEVELHSDVIALVKVSVQPE